uniref:Troponin I4b, tandem duplicate 2 n=1 Tax=Scleropages formosus TaxID=113540 RepID=A0A8C9R0E5_SCLFO
MPSITPVGPDDLVGDIPYSLYDHKRFLLLGEQFRLRSWKKYKDLITRGEVISLLKAGAAILDAEEEKSEVERGKTLNEQVPPLKLPGFSVQELQALCKDLNQNLSLKIFELKGKMKRPNLKRVRISADATLRALLGSKGLNYKTTSNFLSSQKEEATDWRNNAEAVSGMEGRKKLFDATQ